MDGFSVEVLSRLPLADAVLSLLSFATEPEFLGQILNQHRGPCYEGVLKFPTMVNLISNAVLKHEGSGRQAVLHAEEREEQEATQQAVYGKLRRFPVALSNAFPANCTDRLRKVFPEEAASKLPASLRSFDVIAVDGKKIKNVAKRHQTRSQLFGYATGGKTLVGLSA